MDTWNRRSLYFYLLKEWSPFTSDVLIQSIFKHLSVEQKQWDNSATNWASAMVYMWPLRITSIFLETLKNSTWYKVEAWNKLAELKTNLCKTFPAFVSLFCLLKRANLLRGWERTKWTGKRRLINIPATQYADDITVSFNTGIHHNHDILE